VITGLDRDDCGGLVVGLNEGEVVGSHLTETLGVFVDKSGTEDGVGSGRERRVEVDSLSVDVGSGVGVVGPFRRGRSVSDGEEQGLDSVSKSDIIRRSSVGEGVEGLNRGGLHLFDEDISGGTSHSLTFIVGDDGVVGPDVNVAEGRSTVNQLVGSGRRRGVDSLGGSWVIHNEEFIPVSEPELESHFIVGKSGSGEGNTRVSGEEVGKGKVEDKTSDGITSGLGLDELRVVSNHVAISDLLSSGDSEGGPEVQEVVVQSGG